jgi:hypothetical protein
MQLYKHTKNKKHKNARTQHTGTTHNFLSEYVLSIGNAKHGKCMHERKHVEKTEKSEGTLCGEQRRDDDARQSGTYKHDHVIIKGR